MKKSIMILLCIVLVAMSFVSCSGADNEATDSAASKETTKATEAAEVKEMGVNPAGEYPIMNELTPMSALVGMDSLVEDYETNWFTGYYQDLTNVQVEWELVADDNMKTKVNIVLSSGDLPEIIMGGNLTSAQLSNYGSQGILQPLDSLIEEFGLETKKIFDDYPVAEGLMRMADGNIYSMIDVNDCYHCARSTKMWVYMPFLDALGLDVPETTEEFYQALKAIQTGDPNGNGVADEIPLSGAITGWHTNIDGYLMNAFIYNDSETTKGLRLMVEDGNVMPVYNTEEWREGLRYIHKLYDEGLIAPESFSQDNKALKQIGENPDAPILGFVSAGGYGNFIQQYGESGRWLDYYPIAPLEGPDGLRLADYDPYRAFNVGNYVITSACDVPEKAFRWADGLYNQEIVIMAEKGEQGVDWDYAEDGIKGLSGEQALYKSDFEYGTIQNKSWVQTSIANRSAAYRLGNAFDESEIGTSLETILYEASRDNYEPYRVADENCLPPIIFGEDVLSEVSDLELTIVQYIDQMTVAFITGQADVENDWDKYLKELDNMNLARYIELYQQGYDEKYGK